MNYRDLIGISDLYNNAIAFIPDVVKLKNGFYMRGDYCALYIYNFISDKEVICGYKNGAREIYNIETFDNEEWICLKNNDSVEKVALLKKLVPLVTLVGKIEDNKVYSEYFRQGHIYKNELTFIKTLNLSKEELDRLSLKDKIVYIPESSFDDKEFIDLDSKQLKECSDYYTIESIREDIRNYYGDNIMKQISDKDLSSMIIDVFHTVDWQHPSSLLDADQYLDGYIESLGINLDDEIQSKADKLINKYNVPVNDGIKDAIEVVETMQASEISDSTSTYKELELLKVHLYNLYIEDFKENKLDNYMDDLSI